MNKPGDKVKALGGIDIEKGSRGVVVSVKTKVVWDNGKTSTYHGNAQRWLEIDKLLKKGKQ